MDEPERVMQMLGIKGITLEPGFGMRTITSANDPILYPIYERLQDTSDEVDALVQQGMVQESKTT